MGRSKKREEILSEIRVYSEEEFDKLIVYLSSGGLALTIGFINNLIDLNNSNYNLLLIITWLCFTFSLIVNLLSHRSSLKSIDLELQGYEEKSDSWNTFTVILNKSGLIFFISGVVCFIIFVTINF